MPNKEPKYIEADAMLAFVKRADRYVFARSDVISMVNLLPAAPVRQEVHAAWIYKAVDGEVRIACTKCGYKKPYSESLHKFDYCPACGSTMDLDAKGAEDAAQS